MRASSRIAVEIDPSLMVGATRYAIRRWLTSASELAASSIKDNAEQLATDPGCAGAVVREVIDLLNEDWSGTHTIGTREEWEANRARWREVAEAILAHIDERYRVRLEHELAESLHAQ